MSNTITRQWRHTQASSGDGTGYIYIDSKYGSNANGDGSMTKPWQTIEQAEWYCFTKRNAATTVYLADGYYPLTKSICDSSTSTFRMTLIGDTVFGATIDGCGEHMLMRQGGYQNLRLIHMADEVGQPNSALDTTGYTNQHGVFAGVGRARYADFAYCADGAYGFASAPVLFEHGKVFRGTVGGGQSNCVFSNIKRNSTSCGVTLYCHSGTLYNSTAYNCKFIDYVRARRKDQTNATSTGNAFHGEKWLFSNFDIFVDDGSQDSFNKCFFDADCEFIFTNSSKQYAIKLRTTSAETRAYELSAEPIQTKTVSGYGADRTINLYACYVDGCDRMDKAVDYLYTVSGLISGSKPVFGECVWSTQHASDIFNNPTHGDFSLNPSCGAVDEATGEYYGYLPAARHISILDSSDGHLNCFDNRTIDGCLSVVDGVLCIDDNGSSKTGAIYSKVLKIDPKLENLTTIYATHENRGGDGVVLNQNSVFTDTIYTAGSTLTEGVYMVTKGNLDYYDKNGAAQPFKKGEVFIVTADFVTAGLTTFTSSNSAEARYVKDPNQMDCVYVRLRGGIYYEMQAGVNLPKHCTYLNTGNKNIIYNTRTIVPGESFVTTRSDMTFTAEDSDPNYKIGVVFDDRTPDELSAEGASQKLVSEASPFVPAQMFGEYFVYKNQGNMLETTDEFGTVVPQSSGNWRNFSTSGTTQKVPTSAAGDKSVINQPYVQIAVFVNKV